MKKLFSACIVNQLIRVFVVLMTTFITTLPTFAQSFSVVSAKTVPKLNRLMAPIQTSEYPNWIGADVATSIPISDHKYIWLFGDTLIGSSDNKLRTFTYNNMIHNSIGIIIKNKKNHHFSWIKKYFCKDQENNVSAVFQAKSNENYYYWPLVGTYAKKTFIYSGQ